MSVNYRVTKRQNRINQTLHALSSSNGLVGWLVLNSIRFVYKQTKQFQTKENNDNYNYNGNNNNNNN